MTKSTSRPPEPLRLKWLPGRFAVARLGPDDAVQDWALGTDGGFLSITRTADELSIITPQDVVPADVTAERGFVALRIAGTLDFSEVGILASLTGALADARIPVVAVSTYDTDYLLVRVADMQSAALALRHVAAVS